MGYAWAVGGPPNSGKSTLVNALVDRDVAIVTPMAGTTRDVIEVPVVYKGVAYLVFDTAGLRDAPTDSVEAIGIERAASVIGSADILLWLGDDAPPDPAAVWVHSRADMPGRGELPPGKAIAVAAKTGEGVAALWGMIAAKAVSMLPPLDQAAMNARQRALVDSALNSIMAAAEADDLLIVAEEVRVALRKLDAISGRADTEAVLDSIFARFCIGK